VLTSSIFNIKDIEKDKISKMLIQAEEHLKNSEITDQNKYLLDQKIDVLKTLN
jgi:F-type H+-transporting ATPase subunit epsilon/F-type H+-transporting ATPase subunit delta